MRKPGLGKREQQNRTFQETGGRRGKKPKRGGAKRGRAGEKRGPANTKVRARKTLMMKKERRNPKKRSEFIQIFYININFMGYQKEK